MAVSCSTMVSQVSFCEHLRVVLVIGSEPLAPFGHTDDILVALVFCRVGYSRFYWRSRNGWAQMCGGQESRTPHQEGSWWELPCIVMIIIGIK